MATSGLSLLYQNILWIAPALMCMAALLLGIFIRNEVRLVKEAKILSVPLLEQQNLEFQEEGRVVLCMEMPRFSRRYAGLNCALSTHDGVPVDGRPCLFRAMTTGVTRASVQLWVFEIPHQGRYVLRVQGLGAAQEGDATHRLVFTKPHLAQTIGNVIGMILSFGVFITSLVVFLLRLTEKGAGS